MRIRSVWLFLLLVVACGASAQQTTRVAFGCCIDHTKRQNIWDAINHAQPEVFVFLGDTVDVDADDMEDLLDAYEVFNRYRGPRVLRRNSAVMSVWNRKDYSLDGKSGKNNPNRYAVRNHFLTFWREPVTSERLFQEHGIAKSVVFGTEPQRVQVIVLDGRWNRDPLNTVGWLEQQTRRFNAELGPYQPNNSGNLLGDEQWQWLAEQLKKPAEVRILMSATPILSPANGYDSWALYQRELTRLKKLLMELQPSGLLLASGDRLFGEFAQSGEFLSYPLWQVTPGTINFEGESPYQSHYRDGKAFTESRYGQIEVIWKEQPELVLTLRDVDGRPLDSRRIPLSQLQPK
ncbi:MULTISPECIES: phosphodiesterase [Idiomarina]|jgi:alkaline phosphatase D|uniref:phosphodiesterase n=1 Tax=Idiomarina TaxID=135575 RepID=UPI000C0B60FE|nr:MULTISPECIES: phosphodiesterase [Idiomarina]MAC33381.1 phosphodiesterase [Haliea sp.]MAO69148.1 phosphodiesterase [Idiomarina sp.]MBF81755.1 phosphodiesterase [Idiomarina sp.]|tara:strand:+ start:1701 stop:2741 length:1041 start_codon:yes stop_codon:yes gene_type:complete